MTERASLFSGAHGSNEKTISDTNRVVIEGRCVHGVLASDACAECGEIPAAHPRDHARVVPYGDALDLIDERNRLSEALGRAERDADFYKRQLAAVDGALPLWEAERVPGSSAVGRVQTIKNLREDRGALEALSLDLAEEALRLAQMKLPLANRPQATLREKLDLQVRAEIRQHISDALHYIGRHS